MANSNITKRALASSLKELMVEIPFEKITVAHICEKCGMNRKSFYYHFKDKYDLVNWIFDIEYIPIAKSNVIDTSWSLFESLATYFYENKGFYRKVMRITGQNSFHEHFCECLDPVLEYRTKEILGIESPCPLVIQILKDVITSAFGRWLTAPDCMPPEQFIHILKTMTEASSVAVCKEIYEQSNT